MRSNFIGNIGGVFARIMLVACFALPALSGCGVISSAGDFINSKTKFTSKKYGVKASPRLTTSKNIPKGGGRYQVGKPYKVAGKWYTPKENHNYDETGAASWYGPNFHGRQTANGEIFDQYALTAAHPTLPLPSYVRVTNLENNHSIIVRVNDRGPFVGGREIDLSRRTAELLDFIDKGKTRVRVKYVGRAPLEGDDTRMLMASFNAPSNIERATSSSTLVAFASPPKPAPTFTQRPSASPQAGIAVTAQGFNMVTRADDPLGPLYYAAPSVDPAAAVSLINSAFEATEAMANQPSELLGWQASHDRGAPLSIALGTFRDPSNAALVTNAFAEIGAVDQVGVKISGHPAIQLTLSYLKPGVTRQDVVERGQTLGLEDIVLYE